MNKREQKVYSHFKKKREEKKNHNCSFGRFSIGKLSKEEEAILLHTK